MLPRVETVRAVVLILMAVPSLYHTSVIRGTDHHPVGPRRNHHRRSGTDHERLPSASPRQPSTLTKSKHIANHDMHQQDTDCPECKKRKQEKTLTAEELKELRIAMIKKQILNKLKLSHPPRLNVTERPRHLPEPLHRVEEQVVRAEHASTARVQRGKDDFFGKTTEVVVFGNEVGNCFSDHPTGCFHFPVKESLNHEEIKSAELWVYKLPDTGFSNVENQTLTVSRLGNPNRSQPQHGERVDVQSLSAKQGWLRLDVKQLVKRWLHHPAHNYGLEISCKDCAMDEGRSPVATKPDLKPFLVIKTREVRHRRTRRSAVDCQPNTRECCRESFHVKFDDIGWGDWIIQPKKYTANFCRGSCLEPEPILPEYHYSTVMQQVAGNTEDTHRRKQLAPCCAPTRLGSISLIYYDENNAIKVSILPDMVVEACGCM